MSSVGLLFGSFNPAHNGHLWLIKQAKRQTDWQSVYCVLTPQSPARQHDNALIDVRHRWNILNLLLKKTPFAKASDIECSLAAPQYTLNTLTLLKQQYPSTRFELLVGEDTLQDMPRWRTAERLSKWTIWVAARPQPNSHPTSQLPFAHLNTIRHLKTPPYPVSASDIRARLKKNQPIHELVPPNVLQYIQKHQLYQ